METKLKHHPVNIKTLLFSLTIILFMFGCESSSTSNNNCNPKCEERQVCDNNECIDFKIRSKKTKITVGAGNKVSSENFKLKLNVGKIKSIKEVKSSSYKIKLGASEIE